MSENGTEKTRSPWSDVAAQLSDHVDLASLELRYESESLGKSFFALAVAFVFGLAGFIVLQVALIGALRLAGISMGLASLLLSVLYFALAFGVYMKFGRRDPRVGAPFLGTQRELHKTLKWIQNVLS